MTALPSEEPAQVHQGDGVAPVLPKAEVPTEDDQSPAEPPATGEADGPTSQQGGAPLRPSGPTETLDVEHFPVQDDPRLWSRWKKNYVLFVISMANFISTMASAIYFPASPQIQAEFDASNTQIALTASLFILCQGLLPTFWASLSEMTGRKPCYLAQSTIFIGASVGCALAPSINALIGLRVLESLGASAVMSIGAGTLADIYDIHERGRKMGIFYGAPLLAQSCAPLIGGALTSVSNWRSSFWFCVAYGGVVFLLQLTLPEPYRKERSLAWRKAAKRAEALALQKAVKESEDKLRDSTSDASTSESKAPSSPADAYPTPPGSPKIGRAVEDLPAVRAGPSKVVSIHEGKLVMDDGTVAQVKMSWRDINPLSTLGAVVRKPNNVFMSLFTGIWFGVAYCLVYTGGFTYAEAPYNYSPILVGCVLLAFGLGNVIGSVFGGRYSDFVYAKLKAANGGKGEPEMRIQSTWVALIFLPMFLVGYAWAVGEGANVAVCAVLFALTGLAGIWAYSSLLTYVVDANPGRSASAIAFNSACRGTAAFIASQIAQPLLSVMGNGAFYTGFAAVLALSELSLLAVQHWGKMWREGTRQQGRKITDARASVPSSVAGESPPSTSEEPKS